MRWRRRRDNSKGAGSCFHWVTVVLVGNQSSFKRQHRRCVEEGLETGTMNGRTILVALHLGGGMLILGIVDLTDVSRSPRAGTPPPAPRANRAGRLWRARATTSSLLSGVLFCCPVTGAVAWAQSSEDGRRMPKKMCCGPREILVLTLATCRRGSSTTQFVWKTGPLSRMYRPVIDRERFPKPGGDDDRHPQ